jgi:Ca2+-binding RTX toxin-like protein
VVFEKDQILNIEHIIGSTGDDTMGLSTAEATAQALLVAPISITFEGGTGDDTITGGPGDDVLWGDAGDDTLDGAAGDDTITGSAGDVLLTGGTGDDICIEDASDLVAKTGCEM